MHRTRERSGNRARLLCLALAILAQPLAAAAESYEYDAAGRLVRVVYDDLSSITYVYDANGNILTIDRKTAGITGDADQDGDVDEDDVAQVLAAVLAGGEPYSLLNDCNADGQVSVADVVCTVNAMGGGP